MTTLSIINASECTFWASWETRATPQLVAAIEAKPIDEVPGPLPICGPVRIAVNDRRFAVTLFADRLGEETFAVIYQVQTIAEGAPDSEEAVTQLFESLRRIVVDAPVTADLKIDVTLPPSLAWCPGFPRRPDAMGSGIDAAALEFAAAVTIERVGYRFVDGVGGLEEVELVYMHEEDEYTVEIRARSPFQVVPPALVPWAIEELANLVLVRFFRARGAAV